MFVSELGVDDNRHLNCFFGLAAELDFDWALWTLEETNGLMNWNSNFFQRISALQSPLQGMFAKANKANLLNSYLNFVWFHI